MICVYIVSRMNFPYHQDKLFRQHINIKSPKWQKLLIWQSDSFGAHNDNKKKYRKSNALISVLSLTENTQ